ncbi:MAG: hypothetical protein NZ942_01405, partial [Candidatus Aenigmarchaeota archaeon]|nr:hypothetical protein [Candidatus Aenigmarchaeota archaeon]
IVFYFTGIEKEDLNIKLNEKSVDIEFKKSFNLTKEVKERIAKTIKEWVKIEEVRFIDVFK